MPMEDTIEICSGCGKMPRRIDFSEGYYSCSRCHSRATIKVGTNDYERVASELDRHFHERMMKEKAEAVEMHISETTPPRKKIIKVKKETKPVKKKIKKKATKTKKKVIKKKKTVKGKTTKKATTKKKTKTKAKKTTKKAKKRKK